eukprot:scaffold8735_cov129-Isochrysis_galbana.AAC.4
MCDTDGPFGLEHRSEASRGVVVGVAIASHIRVLCNTHAIPSSTLLLVLYSYSSEVFLFRYALRR